MEEGYPFRGAAQTSSRPVKALHMSTIVGHTELHAGTAIVLDVTLFLAHSTLYNGTKSDVPC